MPNITPSKKGGRSVDCSDLLAQKKRSIYLAIARNSNGKGGGTQQSNKQLGYDNGFMELKSKRGLDEYLVRPSVIITATYETAISSIKITGYTLGTITQTQIDDFKNAFASLLGISPNLIQINLSSGSLIIDISLAYSDINTSSLTPNEIAFIVNKDSIIEQLTPTDISTILTDSNTATVITQTGASISIDYRSISVDVNLVNDCIKNKRIINFDNPLVGDNINNCMYTIVDSIVVRINKNGTISTIALFPESQGCGYIFIDSTSSFLVIPSNVKDTTIAGAYDNRLMCNKVYVISLSDGTVFTKTLNNNLFITANAFNQFNNRLYFTSYMSSNYAQYEFIELTNPFITEQITSIQPTNFRSPHNISDSSGITKFIFTSETECYLIFYNNNIRKLVLNNTGTTISSNTSIAGFLFDGNNAGIWTNTGNTWVSAYGRVYGPYLDAPIGTNAFFSFIQDITYDSENNRLLVCDSYAQRIRSVDLTSGNNYAVTTLAGTSPVLYGQAANGPNGTYSPSVLASLGQVGVWNNGTNQMPLYTKVNSSYSNSTFSRPRRITTFKGKIYVLDDIGTRQLVNNHVSDFIVFE